MSTHEDELVERVAREIQECVSDLAETELDCDDYRSFVRVWLTDADAKTLARDAIAAMREALVTDAVIEAVAATICNDDQESVAWPEVPEGPTIPGELSRGRYRWMARDALRVAFGAASMREAEGLDALLERHNVTDVHCVRLRMDDHEITPRWRAYLSRDHIVSAERMWMGEGPTRDAAIRAAVADALAGEGDDA